MSTVKALIKQLQQYDPDAEVVFQIADDEGFDPIAVNEVVLLGPAKVSKNAWRSLYPMTDDANAKTGVCLGFDYENPDYLVAKEAFDAWLKRKRQR